MPQRPVIFDIGMFDAADSQYYLETGHDVVAVEANPMLAEQARRNLREYVEAGQLHIINAALADHPGEVELVLARDDLGSSSICASHGRTGNQGDRCRVVAVTLDDLWARSPAPPRYVKVDIEGADRFCILALRPDRAPDFVSFEVGADASELLGHLHQIGFRRFKLIEQLTFRELSRTNRLTDRLARKLMRSLGFAEPRLIRRQGRWFQIGHSSGPVPWESDGPWFDLTATVGRISECSERTVERNVWFDLHAAR